MLGGEPLDLLALDQRQVLRRLGAFGEVAVAAQAGAGHGLDALDLEDGFGVRCGKVDAHDLGHGFQATAEPGVAQSPHSA